jgi:hypothetical protein
MMRENQKVAKVASDVGLATLAVGVAHVVGLSRLLFWSSWPKTLKAMEIAVLKGEGNVKPFHWTQSRPAAGRSTTRPLRPVRIPVTR